ncbi:MAG TPA: AtpZ/AtpI family protein [Flavobacteriales bacterium]|nr:AtpZ/AtpI family protein [Flavobacteriales bacterium]
MTGTTKTKKLSKKQRKNPLNNYAKYSALGFQMMAIILLSLFAGIKADEYLNMEFPLFTLILTIAGLAASLYYLFKQVLK